MDADLKILTVEEIQLERVLWLWKPFIALGKICLVQGNPGVGKSTIILAITAGVTIGTIPGESDITEPASVIYQTAEDGYSDTIKPCLQQFGADCSRVHVIDEDEYPLSLADDRIEQAIVQTGAKLFVADPLQGFCRGTGMHSVNGMRPLLSKLGGVAARTGCAVVVMSHLRKSGGQAAYRGLGNIDIYAVARSVLTVGELSSDDNTRAIVHIKSNLSPLGKSQAFGLDSNGRALWLGDCDARAEDVMGGKPKQESQFAKARRLLESKLAHGSVPTVEIMQMADDEGISFKTFKRVKDALGVRSFKNGNQWYWDLPVDVVYEEAPQEGRTGEGGRNNTLVPLAVNSA